MWKVSFSPIIERLTRGANIPYFFSAGNHDVTTMPPNDPGRVARVDLETLRADS